MSIFNTVKQDKKQLDERIAELFSFLNQKPVPLIDREVWRLHRQLNIMLDYAKVLQERIDDPQLTAFHKHRPHEVPRPQV